MIKAAIRHKEFRFRRPATTSRGTLLTKQIDFVLLYTEEIPSLYGIGECSLFPGLSADDVQGFGNKLNEVIGQINGGRFQPDTPVHDWPSINFALETASADLRHQGSKILFPSDFTLGKEPILINGLIWMGSKEEMQRQIAQKLDEGFRCLKLKIGALDFNQEYALLRHLRGQFSEHDLELRVDANGAFSPREAPRILAMLAELRIHSIEQPIKPAQPEAMAALCASAPIPIALDEELIGVYPIENKRRLLNAIKPHYLILKPGLLGGIRSCEEWIALADAMNVGWWVTSSLETNIGLNAIAQWTFTLRNPLHQGLSTGKLFESNIKSPLTLSGEKLYYSPHEQWDLSFFNDPQSRCGQEAPRRGASE
jgi:o-succinylbenzoate synthase